MSDARRFMVLHMDKVLCGLWIMWVVYVVSSGILSISTDPESVKTAKTAVELLENSNPSPPALPEYQLRKAFEEATAWTVREGDFKREIFYKAETEDILAPIKQYQSMLEINEALPREKHVLAEISLPNGQKVEHSIFPGSNVFFVVSGNFIDPCLNFVAKQVDVTTVTLEWDDPQNMADGMTISYSMIERRKFAENLDAEKGWQDVLDKDGQPVRLQGGVENVLGDQAELNDVKKAPKFQMPVFERPKPTDRPGPPLGKAGIPDMPGRPVVPRRTPRSSVLIEDQKRDTAIAGLVAFMESLNLDLDSAKELLQSKDASEVRREMDKALSRLNLDVPKALNILEELNKQGDVLSSIEQNHYKLTDFNLDANTMYEYRVRAVGQSRVNETIWGKWSKTIHVKTKEDKGVRFLRYAPAVLGKESKVLSPERVDVRVSKLYEPSWTEIKHFIYYDQRSIEVAAGMEKSRIGSLVNSHPVTDRNGDPVYIDKLNKTMLYAGDEHGTTATSDFKDSKTVTLYREQIDFTTDWIVEKVVEKESVDKTVEMRPNPQTNRMEETTIEKKQYRYFLHLRHVNDAKMVEVVEMDKVYDRPLIPKKP